MKPLTQRATMADVRCLFHLLRIPFLDTDACLSPDFSGCPCGRGTAGKGRATAPGGAARGSKSQPPQPQNRRATAWPRPTPSTPELRKLKCRWPSWLRHPAETAVPLRYQPAVSSSTCPDQPYGRLGPTASAGGTKQTNPPSSIHECLFTSCDVISDTIVLNILF